MNPHEPTFDVPSATVAQIRAFWNSHDPANDQADAIPPAIVNVAEKAPVVALCHGVKGTPWEPNPFSYGFEVVLEYLSRDRVREIAKVFLTIENGRPGYLPDGYNVLETEDFAAADCAWQQALSPSDRLNCLMSLWENNVKGAAPYLISLLPFPEFERSVIERTSKDPNGGHLWRLVKGNFPAVLIARAALAFNAAARDPERPELAEGQQFMAATEFGRAWLRDPNLPGDLTASAVAAFSRIGCAEFTWAHQRHAATQRFAAGTSGRATMMVP